MPHFTSGGRKLILPLCHQTIHLVPLLKSQGPYAMLDRIHLGTHPQLVWLLPLGQYVRCLSQSFIE